MKEISSKEYASLVEDVVWGCLKDGLLHAYELLAEIHGFDGEYPTESIEDAFDMGIAATWRDQAIELFEMYGLDVRPDGKEW